MIKRRRRCVVRVTQDGLLATPSLLATFPPAYYDAKISELLDQGYPVGHSLIMTYQRLMAIALG